MPQVFQVLKCYKCLVFQVHQTKKSNKFQCKMCGEKQSIKRHYGLGNGQECRMHVQKLNGIRGEIDEAIIENNFSSENDSDEVIPNKPVVQHSETKNKSKWSDFVDVIQVSDNTNPNNDEMYLNDTEVVLELPKKRRKPKGRLANNRNTRTYHNNSDFEESNDQNKVELPPRHNESHRRNSDICMNYAVSQTTFINKQSDCSEICSKATKQENSISDHSPGNSKWTSHNTDNQVQNFSKLETNNKEFKKKFVPPPINKNSKWAKFSEENDEENEKYIKNYKDNEEEENYTSKESPIDFIEAISEDNYKSDSGNNSHFPKDLTKYKQQSLFALCDDEDLDDYLTI